MKEIKTSGNLDTAQRYRLMRSNTSKNMQEAAGEKLEVAAWCLYEDLSADTGEMREILAVMDEAAQVYATVSKTFIREFLDMWEFFENDGAHVNAIEVVPGKTKAGRDFITCEYAG